MYIISLCVFLASAFHSINRLYAQSEIKVTASDSRNGSQFGYSVSLNGDYAFIGAPEDDRNGQRSGTVYVFEREGTSWVERIKLTSSDIEAEDEFGISVSSSGDYALVGAWGDNVNGEASGSAYVFKREGGTWIEQAKLTPSDGEAEDIFGEAVSLSGDYALIGAHRDDDNGSQSGSAYVFKREGEVWVEQAKLTPIDGEVADFFGRALSLSGDYALIGARADDDNGVLSGSAYIFERQDTSWVERAKLKASDGVSLDIFGETVSLNGDYALVGAWGDDDNGDNSGSVYVFQRQDTLWIEQAKITPADGKEEDFFGWSISQYEDYALIGTNEENDSGSVYVFQRQDTLWVEKVKFTASDQEEDDRFGFSIAFNENKALVGAWGYELSSGSAYIYDLGEIAGVSIENINNNSNATVELNQNYPNPFNPITTIPYFLKDTEFVRLDLFDMIGRQVKSLVNRSQIPGHYEVTLDASGLAGGMYIYRLSAGNYVESKVLTLLK